jgi:hypothetical protein
LVSICTDEPGLLTPVEEHNEEHPLPSPELHLHIVIEVMSRLRMAQESRSLVYEEMPLIYFLLDQMVLMKEMVLQQGSVVPSIALELLLQKQAALPLDEATSVHQQSSKILGCKTVIAEEPTLPLVVVDSQSDILVSSASLPVAVDVSVAIVGSLDFSVVALGLHASSVVEFFEVKPPDLAAWEVDPMGAVVCSRQSARLVAKCRGGTFKLPVPRHRLPGKVVSKQRMTHPRSCSSCLGLRFIAAASFDRSGMFGGFLRSAHYKDVEALLDRTGCCEQSV